MSLTSTLSESREVQASCLTCTCRLNSSKIEIVIGYNRSGSSSHVISRSTIAMPRYHNQDVHFDSTHKTRCSFRCSSRLGLHFANCGPRRIAPRFDLFDWSSDRRCTPYDTTGLVRSSFYAPVHIRYKRELICQEVPAYFWPRADARSSSIFW